MLLKFGLISGLGWLIDFSIFVALCAVGFIPGVANGIAATVAVTFVYFSSLRPIFQYEGHYMMRKLMAYWLYQIVAVTLASLIVNFLATVGMHSIVAKIVVTPFTFLANYLFMKWLSEVGRSGT
ncbi:GtrA family protein [Achromobacter sp. NPDC008082]|uniref:GtrA family protein n=1 Tax=Achromobacter sp. NPDC008082 TaxID=3363888 RepID=UPI0036E4AE75